MRLAKKEDMRAAVGKSLAEHLESMHEPDTADKDAKGEWAGPDDKFRVETEYRSPRARLEQFLYPQMPPGLKTFAIKRLTPHKLRERYLQTLAASMGNHSLALCYCAWTQEEFEAQLTDEFAGEISRIKMQLADRAAFIMHHGMGLVRFGKEGPVATASPAITAALSRIVERFREQGASPSSSARGGGGGQFRLVVDGLDRAAKAPTEEASFAPQSSSSVPDGLI